MLAGFPATGGDPSVTAKAYLVAVRDIPPEYVELACGRFLSGQVSDRRNPSFAPSGEELSREARRLWSRNLEAGARDRRAQLQIEQRDPKLTAEAMARRRELVESLQGDIARLGNRDTNRPTAEEKTKAYEITGGPFQLSDELRRSLKLSVGDPEDDRDAI